ncbi:hypothetical protein [Bradyrhizobium sp. STM 3843]|uniref:hypothetical protein n=1 Tax=Bradyrhizobium sp. STM 3843 TaxID=551947 RepID=UPI001111B9F8|nr:hypothetical protein [Bradyrhizobium sp. STM 3843]
MELTCSSSEFYSDEMTAPSNIIDAVSDLLGVARATVALQDRMLVTSGHRSITGRGRAARGSPESAAALLLAVAATPLSGPGVKETAVHYERYARLAAIAESGDWAAWPLKHLGSLPAGHSLHEAIAAIIVALGEGVTQASDLFLDAAPDADGVTTDLRIDVELEAPWPHAAITIRADQRRYYQTGEVDPADGVPIFHEDCIAQFKCRIEYRQTREEAEKYFDTLPRHPKAGRRTPDLRQTRRFTIATLAHIAALFSNRVKP